MNIANDPTDVEQRLQAAVVMKRVRVEEFFKDFDKLRKGKVTVPQFKSILSMLNFHLTEDVPSLIQLSLPVASTKTQLPPSSPLPLKIHLLPEESIWK